MDQIIIALNDSSSMETSLYDIGEKLDKLTETVANSATILQSEMGDDEKENEKTQKNILKLKDLRNQYLRSEKMVDYTEELLAKNPPYIQRKHRVKVSRELPEEELECYRTDARHNVTSENEKMKIRMKRWEEEINQLKTDITSALNRPSMLPSMKTKLEQQMHTNEEENQKDREEEIKKIRETYESETKSGAS